MTTRKYGWKKDKHDPRDYKYTVPSRLVSLPPRVDLRPYCSPVEDQGAIGSCTGQAFAGLLEYLDRRDDGAHADVSRLFIYFNERRLEGTTDEDAGAYIRDGIKALKEWGCCDEYLWPYTPGRFSIMPSPDAYQDALKRRIAAYYRVTSLTGLRAALAEGLPVVFGFMVFESFESGEVTKTGVMSMPGADDEFRGGHAVLCLSGDTKVPLLDGRTLSMEELAEQYGNGGEFWVYSCDENKRIVPGRAHSPRKTGEHRDTVTVLLDSGEEIRCTPDHPFLLRDGTYLKAGELVPGQSLMPLYRRVDNKSLVGYEMVLQPDSNCWQYTHRAIAGSAGRYDGIIHHSNFNKRDNSPDNLRPMTWEEHTRLHAEDTIRLKEYATSEIGRSRSRELMKALWADPAWKERSLKRISDNGKAVGRRLAEEGRCGFQAMDKERLREIAKASGPINIRFAQTKEGHAKAMQSQAERRASDPAAAQRKADNARQNISKYNDMLRAGEVQITEAQRKARRSNALRVNELRWANHKIVSVTTSGRTDVYDLTVEEHHNFALSAGVFVHNCVGYDDETRRLIVRNSWGEGWGDSGYFYMPYAYINDPGLSSDFWAIKADGLPVGEEPVIPPPRDVVWYIPIIGILRFIWNWFKRTKPSDKGGQ